MPILTNTAERPERPRRGAVWSIAVPERDLDSNLIRLPAGEEIPAHIGAEVDTLVHVVRGEGVLTTEDGEEPPRAGDVALRCPAARCAGSGRGRTDWSTSPCTDAAGR
ncbi:cupin domain-containing protein [Brachybacterium sp. GPGPB12]|uniref:cupin domain-containing protein n=1 Tax=Brachybacterium sp. GPGPB12 TaxID=3023517 RepID=UPI003134558B